MTQHGQQEQVPLMSESNEEREEKENIYDG